MQTYIVLLRGINVGGHKKVPMVELRTLLSKSGFEDVKTYIQSGNIVLQSLEMRLQIIEDNIQKAINAHFGFEVSVLVKTQTQLQHIFDSCPFSKEKKEKSYFAILHAVPDAELVAIASQKTYENEEYTISDDCLYFFCANGYGKAKFNLNWFEKKLKVDATARNYRTMTKLLEMTTS